jgi:DNA-binding HxlR family transcriptional regulator
LYALLEGERSFAELQADMETITPRMLSRRLREFEDAGIVAARVERRPHHVYYRLKCGVKELREMLAAVQKWGRKLR